MMTTNQPNQEGRKADAGKPRPSLLPWRAIKQIVAVLEFGAAKYGADNWQRVPEARQRYFDATMRHLLAWWDGERLDAESGLPHLAHAGCCILFLLWADKSDEEEKADCEEPDHMESRLKAHKLAQEARDQMRQKLALASQVEQELALARKAHQAAQEARYAGR